MIPINMIPMIEDMQMSHREREYSNPIPKHLFNSECHTSYAQNKRNSKKIKNRKRQKK